MKTIKKMFAFCLALLMAFSVLTVCASAAGPGSTTSTAMSIVLGKTYSGTMGNGQNMYFYKYTLPASGRIFITFYSGDIYNLYIDTYDSATYRVDHNIVYRSDLSGETYFEGFGDLIGGVYYLCLQRRNNSTGNYTFSVSVESSNESFVESDNHQDNTTTAANTISLNRKYTGHIAYNDDVDFYKLSISSATTLPLIIDSSVIWSIKVSLYDSNSYRLWYDNIQYDSISGLLTYRNTLSFSSPGVYYIGFSKYQKNTGSYQFSIGETTPTTYTVTFNGNGGSVSTGSKTVNAGTAISLPSATRSGCTFLGWSESGSASSPSYSAGTSYTVTKNVTLYAVWKANSTPVAQYTVTFNANGGSVSIGSKTVNAGTAISLPSATRSGCTFLGWSENSSAASPSYSAGASYTVNRNVTLYAVWQQNQNQNQNPSPSPNSVNTLQRFYDFLTGIVNFFLRLLGVVGITL